MELDARSLEHRVEVLRTELTIDTPAHPPKLFGTGMIVVNPPFTLERDLNVVLPALAKLFGVDGRGRHRVEWIRGES